MQGPAKFRFEALDQIRGFAILAMIFAHFGPGLYERLGITGDLLHALNLFGRFATPAFVLVFGLTLAIVYIPKAKVDPGRARRVLLRRALTVFFCSLLISVPATATWIGRYVVAPAEVMAFDLLFVQYSVLTFYAVAMSLTALLLSFFAQDATTRGIVLGSLFVFLGTYLAHDVWRPGGQNLMELVRNLFVSGKYGVLVLLGCAWMMMALGMYLNHCLTNGIAWRRNFFILGLAVMLLGLSDGRIVGWRSIDDLAHNFHAPAQLWYMAIVAGLTLTLVAALDKFQFPYLSAVLAQVGKSPLSIYVAHAFVLPGVAVLRQIFPAIPDALSITLCLGLFLAFCAYKIAPGLKPARHPDCAADRYRHHSSEVP